MKQKVIVIAGPTASGKTALSIELAKKINGEIISADSMQIYKEMNIGTAKPDEKEMSGIKHYLLDFVSPSERFSVSDYKIGAEKAIYEIISKGKIPIIVGGTGLYIDSLVYGIQFNKEEIDLKYREELEEIAKKDGLDKLYNLAVSVDPKAMEIISRNDKKRILRVLEIYKKTGKTKTQLEIESRKKESKYDYKVFILDMDREKLYKRINLRVDKMIEAGLIDEVKNVYKKYDCFPTAMQGIGYKEVVSYLENKITKKEMIDMIKQETREYAKRQVTKMLYNIANLTSEGSLLLKRRKGGLNVTNSELMLYLFKELMAEKEKKVRASIEEGSQDYFGGI